MTNVQKTEMVEAVTNVQWQRREAAIKHERLEHLAPINNCLQSLVRDLLAFRTSSDLSSLHPSPIACNPLSVIFSQ